jgi:hypothetical protein
LAQAVDFDKDGRHVVPEQAPKCLYVYVPVHVEVTESGTNKQHSRGRGLGQRVDTMWFQSRLQNACICTCTYTYTCKRFGYVYVQVHIHTRILEPAIVRIHASVLAVYMYMAGSDHA